MLSPLHLILVHAVFSSQPTLRHRGRCPSHSSLFPLLKSVLIKPGSPADRYSPHSFRIGAPTTAGNISLSKQQIKMLGSWCSDAYQSYIRPVSRPPSIGSNVDFPPIAALRCKLSWGVGTLLSCDIGYRHHKTTASYQTRNQTCNECSKSSIPMGELVN